MDQRTIAAGIDPYAVLKLRDGAPRELIEEAYWLFVARHSDPRTGSEIERSQALRELNRAYEEIVRGGIRPLQVSRVIPTRRRWQRRPLEPISWTLNPFETLFIAPGADVELAQVARRVLVEQIPRGMTRKEWERLLASAVEKVEHENWLATPHKSVATATVPVAETAATVSLATAETEQRMKATHVAVERPPIETAVQDTQPEAASATAISKPSPEPTPAAPRTEPTQETQTAIPSRSVAAVEPPPAPAAPDIAPPPAPAEPDTAPSPAPAQPDSLPQPERAAASGHENGHVAPVEDERPEGTLIDRMLGRKERRDEVVDHLQERLLQLRNHQADVAPLPVAKKAGGHKTVAEETADGDGRHRPVQQITEDGVDVVLGGKAAVRIWRRGSAYMLQQTSGGQVLINGDVLMSPMVVLDDDDEIRSGDETIVLRAGRVETLSDAPAGH